MAVEQAVSEGYKAVELVVASGIGGIIGTVVTFFVSWKLQTQKHKHDKQFTVHKLQFKKEFELYVELWKALVAARKTVIITLAIESNDGLTYEEKYNKAIENFNEAKNLFEDNRPFYHDDVSKITRELLSKCRGYLTEVKKIVKSGKDDEDLCDRAEELLEKVPKAIDEIEKAIKQRIDILQKAEIVE